VAYGVHLLRALDAELRKERPMRIQEIMSKPVVTCRPEDPLNTAAQLMWEHDCGAIPVTEDGQLVGIVTDRDICMAAYTQGKPLSEIPVAHAMATQVFSCNPEEALDAAERLMSEKQIRRVPVVNGDNRPVGILSLNDIARHGASTGRAKGIDREVTRTLAAIGTPRPRASDAPRAGR
jgi:CBS domain-containing protein